MFAKVYLPTSSKYLGCVDFCLPKSILEVFHCLCYIFYGIFTVFEGTCLLDISRASLCWYKLTSTRVLALIMNSLFKSQNTWGSFLSSLGLNVTLLFYQDSFNHVTCHILVLKIYFILKIEGRTGNYNAVSKTNLGCSQNNVEGSGNNVACFDIFFMAFEWVFLYFATLYKCIICHKTYDRWEWTTHFVISNFIWRILYLFSYFLNTKTTEQTGRLLEVSTHRYKDP